MYVKREVLTYSKVQYVTGCWIASCNGQVLREP